jgi:hypothetical protein
MLAPPGQICGMLVQPCDHVFCNGGETVSHNVTNNNQTYVHGNTLSDPHQLAAPIHEMNNSKTSSRGGMGSDGRSGSMPAYTGGGGG